MNIQRLCSFVTKLLASRWFFYFILTLFALQASQLVLTSALPMTFDENFHFRVIQIFSDHWQPFLTSQPPDTYAQGALVHNPSILYHYVFSFPYRLLAHLTDNTALQVIGLRFLNVGMAVGTLLVLKRLCGRLKASPLTANLTLFLLALTPMFTALSAQINYDNAVILLSALAGLGAVKLHHQTRPRITTIIGLLNIALLGCLVKFSYLPILVALFLFVGWRLSRDQQRYGVAAMLARFGQQLKRLQSGTKLGYIALAVVSLGLFAGFYGYDLVRYKTPVPQCDQILSIEACHQYYAWERNYQALQDTDDAPPMSVGAYSLLWAQAMYYHLYAELIPWGGIVAIAQPYYVVLLVLAVAAVMGVVVKWRTIYRRHPALKVLGLISIIYLLFLWIRNYSEYVRLGEWVAVQGRYVMPILPFVYLGVVIGVGYWLQGKGKWRGLTASLLLVLLLASFLAYGGSVQYLQHVTPEHNWYTPGHDHGLLAPGSHAGYPALVAWPYTALVAASTLVALAWLRRRS